MALSVKNCLDHIEHTLGGPLPQEIGGIKLVNQAGDFLVSVNPWKWLENVPHKANLRASISVTTGNWDVDEPNRLYVLPDTNFLEDYTFVDGDTFEVTGGTSVTKGHYRVVSRKNRDSLILESDISTTGTDLVNSDIAGTLHTGAIALPADFRDLITIETSSGLLKGITLTTFTELLERRASSVTTTSGNYYAAIVHPQTTALGASTGAPTPRLEIWPSPGANEVAAMTLIYRAGWTTLSSDTALLRIPPYLELPYLEILRALARGFEEEDQGSVSQRLAGVMTGPLMAVAKERDDMVQPHYGRIRNGAAESVLTGGGAFWDFDSIGAPVPPKHLQ